tara:strand:+ start:1086 stop:1202 length:117 start_codon:yes stop_codon:yes gene_type:complete
MTDRSTKVIGSTLGILCGGASSAVLFVYLIQQSLSQLF